MQNQLHGNHVPLSIENCSTSGSGEPWHVSQSVVKDGGRRKRIQWFFVKQFVKVTRPNFNTIKNVLLLEGKKGEDNYNNVTNWACYEREKHSLGVESIHGESLFFAPVKL